MDLNDLARKIELLLDLEAIKTLKHQYCAYCDDNYNPDGIAGLFVEDAVWDGGDFGRCEGREAIRKFFRGAPKMLSLAAQSGDESDYPGGRRPRDGRMEAPATVYSRDQRRAARDVASRQLSRRIRPDPGRMEVSEPQGYCAILHPARSGVGENAVSAELVHRREHVSPAAKQVIGTVRRNSSLCPYETSLRSDSQ
jgi:hypothetical protein